MIGISIKMITNIKLFENYISKGEITNRYLYHKSNPRNRNRILKNGLVPYRGPQWLDSDEIKGDAVFATNSDNEKDWFDSTYDDDVWRIDTSKLSNVKWFFDSHFDWNPDKNKHMYTRSYIPVSALELIKQGTGKDML